MIFAIIDLGTNTFNLLIAESLPGNTYKKLFNTKISVKLGEGAKNLSLLKPVPFERGINALLKYRELIDQYKARQVFAFATSAIRSAANGQDFVAEAKAKANIDIQVIDGSEEAELIYHGNRMAVKMTMDISLIMDIGGGSNEFIIANKDVIIWKQSFKLGAARLLEKFAPSNPITQEEIARINDYLREEMKPLTEAIRQHNPTELIGSSGAFESVVDMIAGAFGTENTQENKTEYRIALDKYKYINNIILRSTIEERRSIKGLIEMRVDMMVISCLLIDFILSEYNITNLRVSAFSLKEGAISKKLGLNKN